VDEDPGVGQRSILTCGDSEGTMGTRTKAN